MALVADDSSSHLPSDSIPIIDLRFFSQSELTSLSLCSEKAFDLRSCRDVIIPKIDRSVFNESAGSRKQTYSRLRLAPRKPEISAVGRGRYNPVPKPHTNPVDDPERKENKEIVSILRGLFGKDSSIQFKEKKNLEIVNVNNEELLQNQSVIVAQPLAQISGVGADGLVVKRKRGRPRKDGRDLQLSLPSIPKPKVPKESGDFYENVAREENVVMEIVNKNGVVVDLAILACSEDPYGPELKNRTAGLASEEELLTFMRELKGQWGSRRKKRKVVDACDFGDALPIGWKLLLSLRRKEGRLSLYCRRYISPTGQQFASCKEVSTYLLPFFGFQSENHPNSLESDESNDEAYKLSSGSSAGLGQRDESTKDECMYHEASPVESVSSEHEKELALLGTENLAEVEVRDLLECHICKRNFDEKDVYLQHLLSSHQRSAKRARNSGASVCDGVIINDGKFECQFCHKIFDERHRYNGHVGVHVRNSVRGIELSSGGTPMQDNVKPSSVNGMPPGSSVVETSADIDKVDATPTSVSNSETVMQDSVNPSSVSRVLPVSSGVEASDDVVKSSVPLTVTPSDESIMHDRLTRHLEVECSKDSGDPSFGSRVLLGYPGVEPSDDVVKSSLTLFTLSDDSVMQDSIKPSHVSGMLPGFSSVQVSEKDFVPPTSVHSNETAMQNIAPTSSGSGVHPEFPGAGELADTDKGAVPPTSGPSVETNVDPSCGKLDMDVSTPNEQSPPRSEPNSGIDVPKPFLANSDVQDVDSPRDDVGSGCNVETSISISNFEPHIGLQCSKQDIVANKIEKTFSGESEDKQDGDVEIPDDKVGRVGNDNINVDFSSCLDSATALYNDVEDCSNGTLEGKDVFTSTTVGKSDDVDQLNNYVDGDFSSCLESANASAHDNVPTSSTVGINMLGSKQRESSFGFAFTSSCNEKINAVASLQKNDVTRTTDGKIDQVLDDVDGDLRSCLVSTNASSCGNVVNDKVSTSSTVGINMFGLKQGGNSFGFAFASSSSQKTNAFESFRGRDVTSTTDGKDDHATGNLGGAFRSCLGSVNSPRDVGNDNVSTRNTVGNNIFGLKQRESSFGFAFPSSCTEKTNAIESFQGKDVTSTMHDKVTNDLDGDFRSCFGTAPDLRTNVENGNIYGTNNIFSGSAVRTNTSGLKQGEGSFSFSFSPSGTEKTNDVETFKGKDVLTSTTVRNWAKVDQTNNYVDGSFRACLESALRDDGEDGINVCEGNNVFTSTTVGTNSGLKQGEHSFSFLFAPSGSERNNGVGTFEGKDVFGGTTSVKSAKVHTPKNDLDGDFRSYLESATAFGNNVESGVDVPYGGNNPTFTDTVGSNMSAPKQGEHSLSFSFAPLGSGKTGGVDFCTDGVFSTSMKKAELEKRREYGFIEQERCFGTNISQPNKEVLIDSAEKGTMLQRLGIETPSPMLQSSGCFPTLDLMSLMSNKEQVESQNFPLQKYDNMSGFEELGFDDLEPSKFGFVTGESNSLSQGHMDLGYDSVMEEALNNSVQFDWEPVAPPKMDTGSSQQPSTVCVWCRMLFNHEGINSEMQSDSVGFMCPTCKAKISGQLSIGSSFNWL